MSTAPAILCYWLWSVTLFFFYFKWTFCYCRGTVMSVLVRAVCVVMQCVGSQVPSQGLVRTRFCAWRWRSIAWRSKAWQCWVHKLRTYAASRRGMGVEWVLWFEKCYVVVASQHPPCPSLLYLDQQVSTFPDSCHLSHPAAFPETHLSQAGEFYFLTLWRWSSRVWFEVYIYVLPVLLMQELRSIFIFLKNKLFSILFSSSYSVEYLKNGVSGHLEN